MTKEELLKVAKPILFSTEMVRAILDDRKTMTRRVVKLDLGLADTDKNDKNYLMIPDEYGDFHSIENFRKYKAGDILWVRETWAWLPSWNCDSPACSCCPDFYKGERGHFIYKENLPDWEGGWKPSIFMPKEAARIFLKVTADSKFERIQDITEEEALKEGCPVDFPMDKIYCPKCKGSGLSGTYCPQTLGYMEIDCPYCDTAKDRFINLWNSLNAKRGYGWANNPWVEVVEFERVKTNGQ